MPAPRVRRGLVIGVVGIVAAAAVGTFAAFVEPERVVGFTRAPIGGGTETDEPYEPERLAEFLPGTYPKSYGYSSVPDPGVMEVHGDSGYVAYTTYEIVHVTAFDLADGEIRWTRDINLNAPVGPLGMVATSQGLIFVINPPGYFQLTMNLDLETGEPRWDLSEAPMTVTGVAGDRLLIYNSDADRVHGYGLDGPTAMPLWSEPADGGRVTEVYLETAATRLLPRDDGDLLHTFDVGTNPDKLQYVVYAAMYSGAISVRKLFTGDVVAVGNAGEKMVDVVAYEDNIYVYRQTPRTLAVYPAGGLSAPKWSIETPPSDDGSDLAVCAENLLCLMTRAGQSTTLQAIDATSGEVRWETADYHLSAIPVMAGGSVGVTHQNGTALLDPETGDVLTEFDSPAVALPGDGVVIGFDDSQIQLISPGEKEPVSLGDVPDPAMPAGACEWTSEVALCAGEEGYQLWRYRG